MRDPKYPTKARLIKRLFIFCSKKWHGKDFAHLPPTNDPTSSVNLLSNADPAHSPLRRRRGTSSPKLEEEEEVKLQTVQSLKEHSMSIQVFL